MSRPPEPPPSGSSRPPLTLALSAVIAARVEQSDRPHLLASLHPRSPHPSEHLRAPGRPEGDRPDVADLDSRRPDQLARVIPLLRHQLPASESELSSSYHDPRVDPDPDPDSDPDSDPGPSAA